MLLALSAVLPGAVFGQEAPDRPAAVTVDEVELKVVKIGPGGRTRAGDWGGVLVEFRDSALKQREILLRLTGYDRDGDKPLYDRVVVGDPERARSAWLYAELPYPEDVPRMAVTAFEAVESPGDPLGFRAGRVLGRTWIDTSRFVAPESALIGVIGQRGLGLRRYSASIEVGGVRCLPLGHGHTEVVSGLTIDDLPDRWQGLVPYEVLVWGRGPLPSALGPDRAEVIVSWVRRGGHLVIVLPPVGQEWLIPARNPLGSVMPRMRIERVENASLEPYRALLTLSEKTLLPGRSVVQVMTPMPGAGALEAMPVLAGPDGRCVVMRRLVGSGMVTVVGLDLASEGLASLGLPDAEAFWHRVLGRRHRLDTFDEIRARDQELASAVQQRAVTDYDADIGRQIDRAGDSSTGVLLGLVVFIAYWLVAGPVGYALLGRFGLRGYAWIAFIGVTGVFTAVAWVGASMLRSRRVEGSHLIFLTQVYGTPTQSARGWMSVLVPSYGEALLGVGDPGHPGSDLIAPWTPPPPSGAGGGFPDNRAYRLSARRPAAMRVPVRSTIKQIRFDWSGAPLWPMPEPARQPGDLGSPGLYLVDPIKGVVSGRLVHQLPGALEDVLVVVVKGQRDVMVSNRGPTWMPALSNMRVPGGGRWEPGEALDLRRVTGSLSGGEEGVKSTPSLTWFDDNAAIGQTRGLGSEVVKAGDPTERFTALSFMHLLGAPDFRFYRNKGRASPLAVVRQSHGLDLSRWFTQPCVIVIGHLVQDGGRPAVPVTVGGDPIESRGRTVVRWIYPLTPAPPGYAYPDS